MNINNLECKKMETRIKYIDGYIYFFPCCSVDDCSYSFKCSYDYFISHMKECLSFYRDYNAKWVEKNCNKSMDCYSQGSSCYNNISLCIDNICNIECLFCCAHNSYKDMNESKLNNRKIQHEIMDRLLDIRLNENGGKFSFIPYTTGEPFSDNYFKNEWLFKVKRQDFENIYIITNCKSIDEDYINRLHEYMDKEKISVYFTASVFSFDKKLYEQEMINSDYCHSMKVIKKLNDMKMLFQINVPITKKNISQIEGFVPFFKSMGIASGTIVNFIKDFTDCSESFNKDFFNATGKKRFYEVTI